MAATLGRQFLLKVGDGATPEVFTTLPDQQTTTATRNGQIVDVTTKDSDAERTLLADGGIKNTVFTVSGIADSSDTQLTLINTQYDAQSINNYQIVWPGSSTTTTFEGGFQISSFETTADTDTSVTYSITLESSGPISSTTA